MLADKVNEGDNAKDFIKIGFPENLGAAELLSEHNRELQGRMMEQMSEHMLQKIKNEMQNKVN